ncbi:helix-turn-helix domain-containing protein [Chloroflexi bacterium TSY]|nr:helix-turn-helix domain-containing protein [Chloroflexi bacterium TSY]
MYQTTASSLIQRLKESVLRAEQVPDDIRPRDDFASANVRESIRTAARSRISQALKQLRALSGLSYADIQEYTGLPQQLLWDIEYTDRRLTFKELEKLAACYGISASDLLGIDLETDLE